MKLFNRFFRGIFLFIVGANILLFATGVDRQIITDDKNNPSIENRLGATAVIGLSAHFSNITIAVNNYIIKSLPDASLGILYMSDRVTPVSVGQHLIQTDADNLFFDPIESSTPATATFTYVGVSDRGVEGTFATVSIPLTVGCATVISNNKENSDIVNSLGATDIVDLSGSNVNGDYVDTFIITSLPTTNQGTLYMADGITAVTLNQRLTEDESDGLKFDPNENFVGDVTFTYVAVDENDIKGNSATITIPLIASTGIKKPIADDKNNNKMLNTLGAVNILNLSGKDGNGNAVNRFIITSLPTENQGILYMADGTTAVTLNQLLTQDEANGLKFDPNKDFVGDVTFTYQAVDSNDIKSLDATVTIPLVNPVAVNAPIADDKKNPEMLNSLGAVNILDLSGKDSSGNSVDTFIITSLPTANQGVLYMTNGTTTVTLNQILTLEEANGLKFDPNGTFIGDVTFTYMAVDSSDVKSANATVTIPLIASHNTDIIANDDEGQANGDAEPITINVLANDTGTLEGATVHLIDTNENMVEELTIVGEGVWSVNEINNVIFTPVAPFVGTPTSITYLVQDANGAVSNSATVTISGQCVCKAYEDDIPVFSSIGLLLMFIFSIILGSLLIKREVLN